MHGRSAVVARLALAVLTLVVLMSPANAAAQGLAPDFQRGASVTSWWHDEYGTTRSDESIAALADTGSTHAALVVTWYQADAASSSVAPDPTKTPTDASLLHAMQTARARGLKPVLKPHIDVHDGTFRAQIAPASVDSWFASYRSMILHYADLAAQGGAETLVIGTELTSMAAYESRWRDMIAEIRTRFAGRLTFAANWDAYGQLAFWDALDDIGVDAYFPLVDEHNPTVDSLVAAWHDRGWVDDLTALQRRFNKPVIFTELGYRSQEGSAARPYDWGTTTAASEEAQQRAYEAFYRVWSQKTWFRGVYWWDWRASGPDTGARDYNPRAKLAEQTMTAWNRGPYSGPPAEPPMPEPPPEGSPFLEADPAADPALNGPPAADASAKPLSPAALRLKLYRRRSARGSRLRVIPVMPRRLDRGQRRCLTSADIVLERSRRTGRGWRRSRTLRPSASSSRRFSVILRPLPPGTYRARLAFTSPCRHSMRSTGLHFRVS